MAEKYAAKGLAVLAVNSWDEEKGGLQRFVKKGSLKQIVLLNGSEVAEQYGVTGVPTNLWINSEGVIVDTELGFDHPKHLSSKTEKLVASPE